MSLGSFMRFARSVRSSGSGPDFRSSYAKFGCRSRKLSAFFGMTLRTALTVRGEKSALLGREEDC